MLISIAQLYIEQESSRKHMPAKDIQIWDLWIADVGATGISFARGRLDPIDVMIVHAAPEKLNVEVRNSEGSVIARGENLSRTSNSPMARLRRQGDKIVREDFWPTEADYGTLVIVAGGEVGTLQKWWNDPGQ